MNHKNYYLFKARGKILDEARKRAAVVNKCDDVDKCRDLANEVKGLLDAFDLISELLKEDDKDVANSNQDQGLKE